MYPSCLAIGNGCFVAEPSCNSKTNNFQDATKATQTENNTFNHKDSESTNYNNRIDSVLVLLSSLSGVVLMAYVVCNLFFCIKRKLHIKKIERNDCTELHFACKNGHESIAKLLLNNGADIHSRTENGATPLHFACENGHDSTVQPLLINGADINSRTVNEATPLHFACKNGHDGTA